LEKAKTDYWDAVAKAWRQSQPQLLWRIHSDAVNCSLLSRWLPASRIERLLKTDLFDEACGDGLYPLLSSRAESVIGMDVSTLAPQTARSRYKGLKALCADVRCLPFTDGTFDVLVSNSTLDHFESQDEILASLRELHRVLRPGGQLLITLDNLANPLVAMRNLLPFRLLKRLKIVPYYVGATFGPRRLKRVLQQLNFEVIELSSLMHSPRVFCIAVAHLLERHASVETQKKYLRFLLAIERLSKLPARYITGQFVAAKAIKRS
jgi:SAM-dependent methyltransferase